MSEKNLLLVSAKEFVIGHTGGTICDSSNHPDPFRSRHARHSFSEIKKHPFPGCQVGNILVKSVHARMIGFLQKRNTGVLKDLQPARFDIIEVVAGEHRNHGGKYVVHQFWQNLVVIMSFNKRKNFTWVFWHGQHRQWITSPVHRAWSDNSQIKAKQNRLQHRVRKQFSLAFQFVLSKRTGISVSAMVKKKENRGCSESIFCQQNIKQLIARTKSSVAPLGSIPE